MCVGYVCVYVRYVLLYMCGMCVCTTAIYVCVYARNACMYVMLCRYVMYFHILCYVCRYVMQVCNARLRFCYECINATLCVSAMLRCVFMIRMYVCMLGAYVCMIIFYYIYVC